MQGGDFPALVEVDGGVLCRERRVRNLEFVLQQMLTAIMALTNYEANDSVANSRKNPLEAWRRLQKLQEEGALCWNSKQGLNDGNFTCRTARKWLKDTFDNEIMFAGPEVLVPEELEKHLILNSNRLRTFDDARLEIVAYVEEKFGLRMSASKRSETEARGLSDPLDVGAINSLASRK